MIQAHNIFKRLGNFQLENISFDIPKGYICGLVGQNGAGKTSLLHILLGLYRPDDGELLIEGHSYDEEEKAIRDMTGTVLNEGLCSAACNLHRNAAYYGRYFSGYDAERMNQLLAEFQLDGRKRLDKLSKGQKLKYQYAFALACRPKLLVLDEPTGNFDPDFREHFLKSLQEFIADGEHTVILASHLTEDIDRFADYIIYLEKGKAVFAGDIETFRNEYRIISGEKYKIQLLNKDKIISMEERKYDTRALVQHSRLNNYDASLTMTYPTIEEFMYYYSRREENRI